MKKLVLLFIVAFWSFVSLWNYVSWSTMDYKKTNLIIENYNFSEKKIWENIIKYNIWFSNYYWNYHNKEWNDCHFAIKDENWTEIFLNVSNFQNGWDYYDTLYILDKWKITSYSFWWEKYLNIEKENFLPRWFYYSSFDYSNNNKKEFDFKNWKIIEKNIFY